MKRVILGLALVVLIALPRLSHTQAITATVTGTVSDSTGAVLPNAEVTAVNRDTGFTRTANTATSGDYQIPQLPAGNYTVSAELSGFTRLAKQVQLQIGQTAVVNFTLAVGQVTQEVEVEATSELAEPTRTAVASVISERQITSLPVNGRQFIDFALLAPGVTIGETTSGSTDVIIEPVTKLSFAGQNIHFNFVAIDGADNISTASGIQKTTPSQEAVKEFQVINTQFSSEAGRAVGGIVNIITKSGTNNWHGSAYEYFRNDKLDADSILASPDPATCNTPGDVTSGGCDLLTKLRQNQFGGTLGGPLQRDKTFIFGNYEGQRRRDNPFYNTVVLQNITFINDLKTNLFNLPAEELNQTRNTDYDNFLVKFDHGISQQHFFFVRYFFNDQRLSNVSPLNDGFDLPSAFKDNFFRDQSLVGNLNSTFGKWINDFRAQWARRSFDFPTVTTQPHLEVLNTFAVGVNRGNPDFYKEWRFELVDNVAVNFGNHTLSFGGNFNLVNTTESFPLFYPLEAQFGCLRAADCPVSMEAGAPQVIFFQRNDTASNFTEPTIIPGGTSVFGAGRIPESIRNLALGELRHTYNGMFIMDKWRALDNLTINFGLRYEFETWPDEAVKTDWDNIDPRVGLAWNIGTKQNIVLRAGAGMFSGTIPSPLLMCQQPSCGGVIGGFPGREDVQDDLNARTRLFAFASDPFFNAIALNALLTTGTYPDAVTGAPGFGIPSFGFCPPGPVAPGGTLAGCAFFGDAVIVRFVKEHQAARGFQTSLALEFEPFRDSVMSISYLRVRGMDLGSFYNVNQPAPSGQQLVHDSQGQAGLKNTFFVAPGIPGTVDPGIGVYFEANSLWDSVYDGLLIDFNKRAGRYLGLGVSYTWSKTIDNGPNPSFVLIPQDNTQFLPAGVDAERAVSSDSVAHRFVANSTIFGPTDTFWLINDFELGTIFTASSPHYFTKFAGIDANGDIFLNNDRVGIEPRNTFKGDEFWSLDVRLARTFNLTEGVKLQALAEAFNVTNTLNVRFFNTTYGAADFCNVPLAERHPTCFVGSNPLNAPLPGFLEGSPNPFYGTPRAIFNPRQIQFALRLSF